MNLKQLTNIFLKSAQLNFEYLYHVTYYNKLESISNNGLKVGSGGSMGQGGNAYRSSGNLFLTELAGVDFWYDKAQDHAESFTDNILADEYIPVVLRLDIGDMNKDIDESGSKDSLHNAFIIKETVDPDYIEVYDGSSWVSLFNYQDIDLMQAIDIDQDPDTGEELYYFKSYGNTLIPNS